MKKLSFLGENEPVVAVLGEKTLRESGDGRAAKQGFCVLTRDKLYWGGRHFFQNYVGDWSDSMEQSSEDISNITAVRYQRRGNPTRTRQSAIRLTVVVVVLSILSELMLRNGSRFNTLFFWMMTFLVSLILSVLTGLRARKNVMLDIEFGCELLSVETSWYEKGELDAFYNQLIQSTAEAHAGEDVLAGMDLKETYGGKKILAEFGSQYRAQYLKDRKCQFGFCTITPGELHFGGKYSWRLLPGVWLKSRKLRDIPISSIASIRYGVAGAPFRVTVLYILVFLFAQTLVLGRSPQSFRFVLSNAALAMLPVLPFWCMGMLKQKRLILETQLGTFAFWTHQGKKADVRQF